MRAIGIPTAIINPGNTSCVSHYSIVNEEIYYDMEMLRGVDFP
jgi:uncharacterized cupin superfamily protein